MSTPEEIQSQEGEGAVQPSETRHESVPESMDLTAAVRQLRALVCGLGAGLLIVSLVLSAFVLKQNRNLAASIATRQRQIVQLQVNQQPVMYAVNELVKYSVGKPELLAIFAKHGLQIKSPSEAGASAPETATPAR
jgi:hypothetical protein